MATLSTVSAPVTLAHNHVLMHFSSAKGQSHRIVEQLRLEGASAHLLQPGRGRAGTPLN